MPVMISIVECSVPDKTSTVNQKINKRILILSLIAFILLLGACSTRNGYRQAEPEDRSCHIIYDAGSSKTRLYVYELTKQGWVTHIGPKTGALADPVRLMRGKTMIDAGSVVDEIIGSLEGIASTSNPIMAVIDALGEDHYVAVTEVTADTVTYVDQDPLYQYSV